MMARVSEIVHCTRLKCRMKVSESGLSVVFVQVVALQAAARVRFSRASFVGVCSVLFALLNVLSEFIMVARVSYAVYCTRLNLGFKN